MPQFTLSNLRDKALSRVENSVLYTLPEVDYVINEAIRVTSLFTGLVRSVVSVPGLSVASKLVYQTPPGILVPGIVTFDGRQLQKVPLRKLARNRRNWATDTTASRGRVEFWAPIGITQFVITPVDAQGGRDISVTGMGEPVKLVNANDIMILENEYVDIITDYCAHRLPLKIGGKIFADGSLALNDFYSAMKQRMHYEKLKIAPYKLIGPKATNVAA